MVRLYHVGFYLRISTDKGEGVETLANHKKLIKDFCTRKGYTYTLYEEVISGASEERPQFEKLINEIHLLLGMYVVKFTIYITTVLE